MAPGGDIPRFRMTWLQLCTRTKPQFLPVSVKYSEGLVPFIEVLFKSSILLLGVRPKVCSFGT